MRQASVLNETVQQEDMAVVTTKRMPASTYGYILIYIMLSSGQIFFNKWVLSSKQLKFPYPLGLTLIHMLFSSGLSFFMVRFKLVKMEQGFTTEMFLTSVFPIGLMFAMTLWLGNSAYLYISVAFAQMLKAIMPVAVFLLGAAFGLESLSVKMLGIMTVISGGVLVASYGEIQFNWIGVIYQLGGVVGEAFRLIFMEVFIKRKGMKLDPVSMMYYVSPCSFICLLVPWLFLELPQMQSSGVWRFDPLIMSCNALCTFALNISVFVVISRTSALTIRVAGVIKDWIVVLTSAVLFLDSNLTALNLFGYFVAILGVILYNQHQLLKPASEAVSSTDEIITIKFQKENETMLSLEKSVHHDKDQRSE